MCATGTAVVKPEREVFVLVVAALLPSLALLATSGVDGTTDAGSPSPTLAAPRAQVQERGVALGLFASDPRYDYGHLLDEIRASGARHVLLAVVWMQQDTRSVRIHRAPGKTADDATVVRTLEQARARGLSTTLLPIVRLERHRAGEWRGTIAPAAGVDAWFASYRDFLSTMASLAARGGAARLSVGSELLSLEGHEAQWRSLIAQVRTQFAGRLTYSANWDHFDAVPFWDALDDVGVTAYFELADDDELPTDAALAARWATPLASLQAVRRRLGRPLLITEVGYPSLVGAARAPWDETRTAPVDQAGQAALVRAFCRAAASTTLDGFYLWNWFGFGGPNDTGYTLRNKPAAREVAACVGPA